MKLVELSNQSFDWIKLIKNIVFFRDGIDRGNLLAVSAILLGLLIPIAIFLVEKAEGDTYNFERSVIFTEVIKKRDILWTVLLLSFPLLFNSALVIPLYIIGLTVYYKIVIRCLRWINIDGKTNEDESNNEVRYSYLKKIDSFDDQIFIWGKIWGDTNYRKRFEEEKLMKDFLDFYKDNYIIIHYERKDKKIFYKAKKFEKTSDSMTESEEIKMIKLRKYTDINAKLENILLLIQKDKENFKLLFQLILDKLDNMQKIKFDNNDVVTYEYKLINNLEIERTILKKCLLFLANNQEKIFEWDLDLYLASIASIINGLEGDEKDLFIGENRISFEKIPWKKIIDDISKQRQGVIDSLSNLDFDKVLRSATRTQSETMELGRESNVGEEINALIKDDPFFD
ncbi:hypothetical protein NGA84_01580 [Lactococcus formosensis]|uniref:Uncharacterized protein n=2 Tax=Lactococcus formosensis TaxID=1281486 RepID=A0A9X4SFK8_9LACT|nr:hypothetical protein [Lactococcus formosensis]MDG6142038.1 hypothetical protein [Lactococcus formosensis]MDG6159242.1 hypothetical protein [Lactococcus formosensis]MDG6165477.1 hypothetical protein [Lactococcus formosensis]MDG6171930.1 hypothetical protein [Lactococcus formosensis]MDG6192696.1 hypothetical protein [Lactococcus formosensis]